MSNKNNYVLAGISAAAVAVLSVGGYFLHRKVLKHRLWEQARRFSMNLAVFNPYNDKDLYNDFDDYDDDSDDGDYIKNLMQDFDTEDYDE